MSTSGRMTYKADGRRIARLSRVTVAGTQAQVAIARRLGKPVAPTAATQGPARQDTSSGPIEEAGRSTGRVTYTEDGRRVVRVSRETVAAAQAQVAIAQQLGRPINPAVAKIALIPLP